MNPTERHRWIVLNERPVGAPNDQTFRLMEGPLPSPKSGEVLLKTRFLSLDPYMRSRISEAPSYVAPVGIGELMVGGTVSQVIESQHDGLNEGDLVLGYTGWQNYSVAMGREVHKLDPKMARPSLALGILGMPGFTAYMGLLDIGKPKAGETLVVAAATGAVGSAVGQIAKLHGCRVVGIAGGPEKCRFAIEELGFDACLDHRLPNLNASLKEACPKGIDIYFENVGGKVLEAVIPCLNTKARIPVCGMIAHYNDTELPNGPNRLPQLMRAILVKRITVQGFIIFDDYGDQMGRFMVEMSRWIAAGSIRFREDIIQGLESAPEAFAGLLAGKNFGKLLIEM